MKVLAVNGSPRPMGNVSNILHEVSDMFEREGVEVEYLHIYDHQFANCNVCMTCEIRGDCRCADEDDGLNEILEQMRGADAILIASPTYMNGCPSMLQTFLERAMLVMRHGGFPLTGKPGGVITVCGHDGGSLVYNQLTDFLLRNKMLAVGAYPLPIIRSWHSPGYEDDVEGMRGVRSLVEGMVDALVRLEERRRKKKNPQPSDWEILATASILSRGPE